MFVNTSGNAGLFGEIAITGEATVQGVRLVDATVIGGTGRSAGALAGKADNCTFTDCWVYWSDPNNNKLVTGTTSKTIDPKVKVSGSSGLISNAGGLIGSASGAVSINDSFAATTVKGTNAGGLVGSGAVQVSNSYADCYLEGGTNAGGLIGSDSATLTNCYAAGFITAGANTAGLVNGSVSSTSSKVYSVVRVIGDDGNLLEPNTPLYTGSSGTGSVLYLSKKEDVTDEVKAVLGGKFEMKEEKTLGPTATEAEKAEALAKRTHPYNLRHKLDPTANPTLRLDPPYPFPGLKGLPHYGDWGDLKAIPAGLVYYREI